VLNSILLVQSSSGSGLTLGRILRDIPHDAPAMVVYALLIAFTYLVWRGSRPKKGV
jgi:hypothetical protein